VVHRHEPDQEQDGGRLKSTEIGAIRFGGTKQYGEFLTLLQFMICPPKHCVI
jgi:hypothetical protein